MTFRSGDRVRVRQPERGKPWHTSKGRAYWRECQPGELGTVVSHYSDDAPVSVRWDSDRTRTSRIDQECLEGIESVEKELDQEMLRLLGIDKKHCKTCTCED